MQTSISYLAQDPVFDVEKPFDTDVPVNYIARARASNHSNDERDVTVIPIVDPTEWDLEKHGFCFIKAKTGLKAEDALTRKREVQKDYWYEIEALLHERFPQYSRIDCYDCTVRCLLVLPLDIGLSLKRNAGPEERPRFPREYQDLHQSRAASTKTSQ